MPAVRSAAARNRTAAAAAAASDAGDAGAAGLPPLSAAAPIVDLAVDGFAPAVVSLPRGARQPKPLVVATHGNFDRPTWQCQEWRAVVKDQAFVLCPRGTARGDSPSQRDIRFTYGSNQKLEQELDAAIGALRQRFGDYLASGPVVYSGFSLGAIMGVSIASRSPTRYPQLVLVEGGHDRWSAARVRDFAAGGGKRVLFVCGQRGCELAARAAAKRLERAGVPTRIRLVAKQGHSYGGAMNAPIVESWSWLVAGDSRYPVDGEPAR